MQLQYMYRRKVESSTTDRLVRNFTTEYEVEFSYSFCHHRLLR